MSKELEIKTCQACDSEYKLVYHLDKTSGYPKFCPFCGEEGYDDEVVEDDYDNE